MIEIRDKPLIKCNSDEFIFVKEKYLDLNICKNLINEHNDKVLPGSSTYNKGTFSKFNLDKNHNIHLKLSDIWDEIINYFGIKIDFIEPYNIKKYTYGNYYDNHVDNFSSNLDRRLSFIVLLSDSKEYGNGDLVINGKTMTREQGSIIVFPSNYMHKVNYVGFGERWVLITWAWGPTFIRGN